MIDSHCHLADDAYAADAAQVIARAHVAGLTGALCILDAGSDTERARVGVLSALWPELRYSIGVHPHQAAAYASHPDRAAALVGDAIDATPGARAIGEIGLDYHYDFAPREVQHAVFSVQLRLAVERDLPVVIHGREADDDILALLQRAGSGRLRGVLHCFTSGVDVARRALDLGFLIGLGGIVTFPKGGNVRDMARTVPLDRTLIETDSPFLAPVPHRGKRNEPAWVARVADAVAAIHGVTVEDVVTRTSAAYTDLIRP